MKTQELIQKWKDKHSDMLDYYSSTKGLSENNLLFLRSEMKHVLEFISDLENITN